MQEAILFLLQLTNGLCVFPRCCTLRVNFSNRQSLDISREDDMIRDFVRHPASVQELRNVNMNAVGGAQRENERFQDFREVRDPLNSLASLQPLRKWRIDFCRVRSFIEWGLLCAAGNKGHWGTLDADWLWYWLTKWWQLHFLTFKKECDYSIKYRLLCHWISKDNHKTSTRIDSIAADWCFLRSIISHQYQIESRTD